MRTPRPPVTTSAWHATLALDDQASQERGEITFRRLRRSTDDSSARLFEWGKTDLVEVDISEVSFVTDFLRLATEDSEEIVNFAQIYGPLGLCDHGLPMTHIPSSALPYVDEETHNTHHPGVVLSRLHVSERIEDWRRLAAQAGSIYRLAAKGREWGNSERPEGAPRPKDEGLQAIVKDWITVGDLLDDPVPITMPWVPSSDNDPTSIAVTTDNGTLHLASTSHFSEIDQLAFCSGAPLRRRAIRGLQRWFDWAGLAARIEWEETEYPEVRWSANQLFGAIALQLALSISGTPRFSVCAACHRPTLRKRAPKHGQHQWCTKDECQKEKKKREAKKNRDKKRASKRASSVEPLRESGDRGF